MHRVLIDTASPAIGVAAYSGDRCVGAWTTTLGAGADGWLTPALAAAVAALPQLDAVAVVTGPGAFTGLRVGLAHGLGLAFARGVPVLAVPSLTLRATALPGHAHALLLLDARKGRLYAQAFDTRGDLPLTLGDPADLPPEALVGLVVPGTVAGGEGVAVVREHLAAFGVVTVELGADAALRAAGPLLASLPLRNPASVVPDYVREPDARPPSGLPVTL